MKIRGFKDTIKWYDKNAVNYAFSASQFLSREQINDFLLRIPGGGKILDAGCGSGRDTNEFSKKDYDVVGIDISVGLLNEARKSFPKCTFVNGNLLDLPFEKGFFDGIWAHASILHLETIIEVKRVLLEFYRVLKHGGVIHLLVKAQTGKNKTDIVSDKLSGHERFFQYFKKEEVKKLLTDAGFKIMKLEQYKETDENPKGRPEVEWILILGEKV